MRKCPSVIGSRHYEPRPPSPISRRMGGAVEIGESEGALLERENRLALLRLTAAIPALSFPPILFRLSEVGPTATAFYRTCLALPIIVGWMLVEQRGIARR